MLKILNFYTEILYFLATCFGCVTLCSQYAGSSLGLLTLLDS